MEYSLLCGDVMPGCVARFTADDREQLLELVAAHASETHDIDRLTPEVRTAVEDAIVVTPDDDGR